MERLPKDWIDKKVNTCYDLGKWHFRSLVFLDETDKNRFVLRGPLFVSGLDTCRISDGPCINDNTSTSFAPTGEQPNGLFLTPVAYHGSTSSAFENAAVASTIGSPTFSSVPEPSLLLGSMTVLGLGFSLRKKTR